VRTNRPPSSLRRALPRPARVHLAHPRLADLRRVLPVQRALLHRPARHAGLARLAGQAVPAQVVRVRVADLPAAHLRTAQLVVHVPVARAQAARVPTAARPARPIPAEHTRRRPYTTRWWL
jgi:hypothetical protein